MGRSKIKVSSHWYCNPPGDILHQYSRLEKIRLSWVKAETQNFEDRNTVFQGMGPKDGANHFRLSYNL